MGRDVAFMDRYGRLSALRFDRTSDHADDTAAVLARGLQGVAPMLHS
jgi:hypothetical protein